MTNLLKILLTLTVITIFTVTILDISVLSGQEVLNNQEISFKVEGMTCKVCPLTIKKSLQKLDGVIDADVSFNTKKAKVLFLKDKVTEDDMLSAIQNAGFEAVIIKN